MGLLSDYKMRHSYILRVIINIGDDEIYRYGKFVVKGLNKTAIKLILLAVVLETTY